MQGGGKRNPAKNRQIAAAWMVLSLVAEQGGYPAVAGKREDAFRLLVGDPLSEFFEVRSDARACSERLSLDWGCIEPFGP
jgi:hypothetical protein